MRIFNINQTKIDSTYTDLVSSFPGSTYENDRFFLKSETQEIDMYYYGQFPSIKISVLSMQLEEDTLFIDLQGDPNIVVFRFTLKSVLKYQIPDQEDSKEVLLHGGAMYNSQFPLELLVPKNQPVRFVTIRINLNLVPEFRNVAWAEFDSLLFNPKPWILFESLNHEMENLLKDIFAIQTIEEGRRGYSVAKSLELVTTFLKQLGRRRNEKDALGAITISPELLFKIKDALVADFEHPISIKELAENFGMSMQKLRINFKNFFGQSPNQLWQQVRYEEADRRLKYSEEPIHSIAIGLGFKDATHFTKGFKERRGVSPTEFRKS